MPDSVSLASFAALMIPEDAVKQYPVVAAVVPMYLYPSMLNIAGHQMLSTQLTWLLQNT
jgi:hypothetical protein